MAEDERNPDAGPALNRALGDFLKQAEKEPISPRLRKLVQQLDEALDDARRRREKDDGPDTESG